MKRKCFIALSSCILLNAACVNEIETEVQKSEVPITFSVKIKEAQTKVSNNAFEKNDQIGLYAMLHGNTVSGERYIDNLLLTCGDGSTLLPEKPIFYPEGDYTLDFTAYYPYQADGLPSGSALIPVSIQADQSKADYYSASDFMTANRTNIESSDEAVELSFTHRFAKLKLSLIPSKKMTAAQIKQDNPHIVATGFPTRANYNLETEELSDFEAISDIIPIGEWEEENGKLVGKELILFPRAFEKGQALQMEWNGRVYSCPIPSHEPLENNKQYELEINAEETANHILNGVIASIEDWEPADKLDATNSIDGTTALHLAVLSFEESNVYHIHVGGKEVAEISKEYLISDELTSTAITSYPLKNGVPDLTQGTVLQLLDIKEAINGGTISWDTSDNSFTYQKGDKPLIQQIYFDAQGTLCLEVPETPAKLNILANTLYDYRDFSNPQHYPIVKIGAQYWMRENLKADRYINGEMLKELTLLNGEAGFYESDGNYFYSGEAVINDAISPKGWGIPSQSEWESLDKYIKGDVAKVKAGEWAILDAESDDFDEVAPIDNKTMFHIYPFGIFSVEGAINKNKIAAYWIWNYENNKLSENTTYFTGGNNEIQYLTAIASGGEGFYKGLSIRLIKK